MLKLWVALQAVACTNNSDISLQNKSQSSDYRHTSLLHPDWELRFLPPRWSYHSCDELELNTLYTHLAKYLDILVQDIDIDDENLLNSIKQWEQIFLEGVTIGSTSSTFSKCDVARENYFIRIWHENQSGNRHYTYSDVYGEIHHYLEIQLSPNVSPLLLAYFQQYDVLHTSGLVEQLQTSGDHKFIDAESIRALLGHFQCTGRVRNREVEKTWFINKDHVYKMMKVLSEYGNSAHGRIEVTDNSENNEDSLHENSNDSWSDRDDVLNYIDED